MSGNDWQLIVVVTALAAAAAHLVTRGIRRTWRSGARSGAGSCSACGSCSPGTGKPGGAPNGFVPLDTLRTSANNVGSE
jgi:hypothetical protein